MKEIEGRADVYLLVSNFYHLVRKDELLAPIFNYHISEKQWDLHIEKLTDFWMTALFGIACFKGNPGRVHKKVDANFNHSISEDYFEKWLELWYKSIDNKYQGAMAHRAKDAARNMATSQYLTILHNRHKTYNNGSI